MRYGNGGTGRGRHQRAMCPRDGRTVPMAKDGGLLPAGSVGSTATQGSIDVSGKAVVGCLLGCHVVGDAGPERVALGNLDQ